MRQIEKAIKREKSKLIKKAKEKGLYEDFGQKEVRKLEDRFIDSSDYTEEMNRDRRLIEMFEVFCSCYPGE